MKTLNVEVFCQAYFCSSIKVPDDMGLEDAIQYAKAHIDEIPRSELEFIPFSNELNEEECYF
jgi:hypothetical protein